MVSTRHVADRRSTKHRDCRLAHPTFDWHPIANVAAAIIFPCTGVLPCRRFASQPAHPFEGAVMHSTLKYLAAMASCVLFATSASAQSVTDIREPSPDQATAQRDGERSTRKRLAGAAMGRA